MGTTVAGFFVIRKFCYRPTDNADTTKGKTTDVVEDELDFGKKQRLETCQTLIKTKYLSLKQKLGKAVDNRNCFYDALSQALETIGIQASIETLRNDVAEVLQDSHC